LQRHSSMRCSQMEGSTIGTACSASLSPCCSVSQCVAACRSVSQCVAVRCSILQCHSSNTCSQTGGNAVSTVSCDTPHIELITSHICMRHIYKWAMPHIRLHHTYKWVMPHMRILHTYPGVTPHIMYAYVIWLIHMCRVSHFYVTHIQESRHT